MGDARHLTAQELEAGLDQISLSPKNTGPVELIVRRPRVGERETLSAATLDLAVGLVGDSWSARGSSPHLDRQLTLMNARVISLVAQTKERWPLAGDQLFVDLDLSAANMPSGTRLAIGSAIVEVTAPPHTGCAKFAARFGQDAFLFVNAPEHKELRLRGVNARVIQPGEIRVGDTVTVVQRPEA